MDQMAVSFSGVISRLLPSDERTEYLSLNVNGYNAAIANEKGFSVMKTSEGGVIILKCREDTAVGIFEKFADLEVNVFGEVHNFEIELPG
jgi:hypothetical protein